MACVVWSELALHEAHACSERAVKLHECCTARLGGTGWVMFAHKHCYTLQPGHLVCTPGCR